MELDDIINTAILFDPINWIVVTLILLFVGVALFAIHSNANDFIPSLA